MAFDSNLVVYNPSSDPLVNFNFMLRVELAIDVPCKSVRAFTSELEFEQIQEGGLNDYVHMRRKPISRPSTLEVERYVGTDYFDPLPLGADLTLPVLLFVARTPAQFVPGVTARTYVFHGCTVIKKVYGELSADQAGILTETITLSYREMLCIDTPWSQVADNLFAPDPAQAHSAKTQSTEPVELKRLGQQLYTEADHEKKKADELFIASDVTALIAELKTLEADVKAAVDEKTPGWLAAEEEQAKNTLNGENRTPPKPLFDTVNELKAQVLEQKNILHEVEKELRREKDAAHRQAQSQARKQKAATEKLVHYKEQKKRAEDEIKELKEKLPDQNLNLEEDTILSRIAALEKSVEGFNARIEEAKADGAVDSDEEGAASDATADSGETNEKASEANTSVDEAAEKYEAARAELEKKETELAAAQNHAVSAQKALADAIEHMKKGKQYAHSLTNTINNLELRKTSVEDAQKKYGVSLTACSSANETLQNCDEHDKQEFNKIRTMYQEVKKHHDDTIVQTKKVGEAEEYRKKGEELKDQVTNWWTSLQTSKP